MNTILLLAFAMGVMPPRQLPSEDEPPKVELRQFSHDAPEFAELREPLSAWLTRAEPGLTIETLLGTADYGFASNLGTNICQFRLGKVEVTRGQIRRLQMNRSGQPNSVHDGKPPATFEEQREIAERWINAFLPQGYVARDMRQGPAPQILRFSIGIQGNPEVIINKTFVGTAQIHPIRRRPIQISWAITDLPKYDPSTVTAKVSTDRLLAEARRVFYAVEPQEGGRVVTHFTYFVPSNRGVSEDAWHEERRELTQDHYRQIEDKRPSLFYSVDVWFPVIRDRGAPVQSILVDARTGKAVSWEKWVFPAPSNMGPTSSKAPEEFVGAWKAPTGVSGYLTAATIPFPATSFPTFLTDPKGTLRSVAYDPKAGLIKVEDQVLKVDSILRKALPTKPPMRGVFGKPSTNLRT